MNTILSLIILLAQNSLKKDINYTIATYILNHIDDVASMGIKELSEACYTSTTSIIKFCKIIGYDSFSEFKRQYITNLDIRKIQLKTKLSKISDQELVSKIQSFAINSFDQEQLLESVKKCVKIIQETKTIYLYGATFPLALSQSFIEDMAIMGVKCNVVQIARGSHQDIESHNGLHMIISLSGRLLEIKNNEYLKIIHSNENTVLLSRKESNTTKYHINIPATSSSEYDEVILLLLFNIIKYMYYVS